MGILWFGGAASLEDLKEKDLKRERLVQEVQQDQLVTRVKNAQGDYEGLLQAASEPGLTDAEVDIAAYKMDQASKRRDRAENDLQGVLTRMSVLDSTLDLLQQRAELEKKGVWKTINSMDENALQAQLEEFAADRKGSQLNVNRIAEMLEVDSMAVKAKRSSGFQKSRAAIEAARAEKSG
jgi:hypothetical protein|tara:strand:- start:1161 stop:1700 length:540 start_codon:yes stop_codon:yes gene_type:complete